MTQTLLFATASTTDDPCARKHRGDRQSVRAWRQPGKDTVRVKIIEYAKTNGLHGITLHETCLALNKPANSLSGRFTELVGHGLIKTTETRLSPAGCLEAVYVVMP